MTNIAVLVSGGGTNLQALIDAQQAGKIENGRIALVVSSNPKAYALERAAAANIPSLVLRRKCIRRTSRRPCISSAAGRKTEKGTQGTDLAACLFAYCIKISG